MNGFDPSRHFQIADRPVDSRGIPLVPLDLVVINRIPEHYYSDDEFRTLAEYEGHYGLVTYSSIGGLVEPYYAGDQSHPGWVSGDLRAVNVLSRDIRDGHIRSWEFWIPANDLTKLPYNCLIMNIFADYPWQMRDEDGPSTHRFVVSGMEQYAHIEFVMTSPYQKLVEAHNLAMATLRCK